MSDYNPWTSIIPVVLHEESIKQFGKLLGVETLPSPTSVLAIPNHGEERDEDEFQGKVNNLATNFINETERLLLIHLQHCGSMNVCQTDLQYAIEQFTKAYLREPAPYLQMYETDHDEHSGENYDSDEEWIPFDSEEHESDSDIDMDHMLDEEFDAVDESDNETMYECEENEEAWIVKPIHYPTLLFDNTFPELSESDEFFKISNQDFCALALEVMHQRFRCEYYFDEQCLQIFKLSMIRYILVECRN